VFEWCANRKVDEQTEFGYWHIPYKSKIQGSSSLVARHQRSWWCFMV